MASDSNTFAGIVFSGVHEAAPTDAPSWRNGLHADWKLQLGDRTFEVHKVIIARAAKVLSGGVSGSYATLGVTDLTKFHSQIT